MHRDAQREKRRNNHDERCERIKTSYRREVISEIRAEEREREMREVDLTEEAPRQAEAEPEQAVQRADEHAGKYGLPE